MKKLLVILAVLAMAAPTYAYLYDTGGPAAKDWGYTISGGYVGVWSMWHKFQVPAGVWNITSVGVAGWMVVDQNNTGMSATFYKDTGGVPNLGGQIGNPSVLYMPGSTGNWTDAAVTGVQLTGGVWYWVGFDSDRGYWGAIHPGNGPGCNGAASYQSPDHGVSLPYPNDPIASMRINGSVVPEPGLISLGGLLLGAIGMALKRR